MQKDLESRVRGMMTHPADSRLLTVKHVAEMCGVSPRTVRRWIDARELHVHRLGRQLRVSSEDLAAFVKLRRQ